MKRIMPWIRKQVETISFYANLYRASRIGKKFYAEYEHLVKNIAFHPDLKPRLDVYSPATGSGHPVFLFVHGGGWKENDKELFAPAAMKLVPEDMVVVIPDHTLYPDARCEQMAHEVAAALSWTLDHIAQYGGDPKRVFIGGHSSGAHLMALAVADPRFLSAYGHSPGQVCGLIGISGVYDVQAQYEFDQTEGQNTNSELPDIMGGRANFARMSPLHYVQSDLPPILLIHGDKDEIVPLRSSADFHHALLQAGVHSALKVYPGHKHSDILFEALALERAPFVADVAEFVRLR